MSANLDLSREITGLHVSVDMTARVIRVAGELDLATHAAVRQAGEHLVAAATADIVLDLAGVSFIDAAGLAAVVELQNIQSRNGQRLRVQAAPPSIARVFDLAGLGALLPAASRTPQAGGVAAPRSMHAVLSPSTR